MIHLHVSWSTVWVVVVPTGQEVMELGRDIELQVQRNDGGSMEEWKTSL